jgi:thioesterase domain-containing protein
MDRLSLSSVADSLSVLLPIRANGDGPVLFCIHPGGGLSWGYMPLARYVPEDLRLYALQARGLDGNSDFAASIRHMAADYITQMQAIQPTGPYHLLGYSLGGIIAHEIAVQLQAMGEQVANLVIGDAYPPRPRPEGETEDQDRPPRPGEPSDRDPSPPSEEERMARTLDLVRREAGRILGAISDEEMLRLAELFHRGTVLLDAHEFSRYDGNMLLLVATQGRRDDDPIAEPWEAFVTGVISQAPLPCSHSDLLTPEMLEAAWSAISENWRS